MWEEFWTASAACGRQPCAEAPQKLEVSDYERGVGATESERVGEEGVEVVGDSLARDVEFGGIFVGVLEVEVGGYEIVLHHEYGVDDFACSGHPHLVACLAFGGCDVGFVVSEDTVDGLGLVLVADVC